MNKFLSLTAACSLFAAPAAFALNAQTHHCDLNGAEVTKTKAECKKAGGKWAKGAPTTAAAPSTTPTSSTTNAGKPSTSNPDPARNPANNKALPANTPPTPNGNNTMTPPPGERTPGN